MTPEPVRTVAAAVARWCAAHLADDTPVIVACSGGADSLALALGVRHGVPTRRHTAVVVDHGLQGGSDRQAARAAEVLRGIGFDEVEVIAVAVAGPGGVEAAARRARYAALGGVATRTGGAVLLGHTADDQAETVLLGLGRGSGPRSIAGMRPWRPPWGRPLLALRRSDTAAACTAADLLPWQDPQNADPAFTRVRLRCEVMPLLDGVLGGGVVPALARTADLMAEDLAALDGIAAAALEAAWLPDGSLALGAIVTQPVAVRRRVLRGFAGRRGAGPLTALHLRELDCLAFGPAGHGPVRLPGGVDIGRAGDRLR